MRICQITISHLNVNTGYDLLIDYQKYTKLIAINNSSITQLISLKLHIWPIAGTPNSNTVGVFFLLNINNIADLDFVS